ncbi:MAG: fused MFS/spermidine synthase [Bryobacteraceae bacterium]
MIKQDTFFRLLAWAVASAEGFSTLAVEVIAIRLAIPVVGSSMTLTGVLLAVILFALSAGYWHGGQLSSRWSRSRARTALSVNLFLAAVIYAAVSFPFEAALLERLLDAGLSLAPAIGVAATLLFAVPVYLVAQSVPLLAELTNDEGKAGKASGRVLFYSTLGSVAGGIVTPVYLFPNFGVKVSTYAICGLLFAAAALWTASHRRRWMVAVAGAALLTIVSRAGLGSPVPANQRFRFDSPHQTIRIVDERRANGRVERAMYLNGGRASAIYADTGETSVGYVLEADRLLAASPCALVLAVGAAGFTFPRDVSALPEVVRVDAVDVDPDVLDIAERWFLPQPLPAKVRFVPLSARYALRRARGQGVRYGFTLLDAYTGKAIPAELLSREFIADVRAVSARTAANVILDRAAESDFAKNVLATFRQVFGQVWIKDVNPGDSDLTNYMITDWPIAGSAEWTGAGRIYLDDRNSADRDHTRMIWSEE